MKKPVIVTKLSWPIATICTIKIDPKIPMTEERKANIKLAMAMVRAYDHE